MDVAQAFYENDWRPEVESRNRAGIVHAPPPACDSQASLAGW